MCKYINEEVKSAKYRIELYIDSNNNANLLVHTVGENFVETEQAFIKFIAKIQEQIDHKNRCPFNPINRK